MSIPGKARNRTSKAHHVQNNSTKAPKVVFGRRIARSRHRFFEKTVNANIYETDENMQSETASIDGSASSIASIVV